MILEQIFKNRLRTLLAQIDEGGEADTLIQEFIASFSDEQISLMVDNEMFGSPDGDYRLGHFRKCKVMQGRPYPIEEVKEVLDYWLLELVDDVEERDFWL